MARQVSEVAKWQRFNTRSGGCTCPTAACLPIEHAVRDLAHARHRRCQTNAREDVPGNNKRGDNKGR